MSQPPTVNPDKPRYDVRALFPTIEELHAIETYIQGGDDTGFVVEMFGEPRMPSGLVVLWSGSLGPPGRFQLEIQAWHHSPDISRAIDQFRRCRRTQFRVDNRVSRKLRREALFVWCGHIRVLGNEFLITRPPDGFFGSSSCRNPRGAT